MAAGGMSPASAANWASSSCAGKGVTRVTACEFCAVTAATTGHRCTPKASAARWSAARPAPPPLSLPAMLQRMGLRAGSWAGSQSASRPDSCVDSVMAGQVSTPGSPDGAAARRDQNGHKPPNAASRRARGSRLICQREGKRADFCRARRWASLIFAPSFIA